MAFLRCLAVLQSCVLSCDNNNQRDFYKLPRRGKLSITPSNMGSRLNRSNPILNGDIGQIHHCVSKTRALKIELIEPFLSVKLSSEAYFLTLGFL